MNHICEKCRPCVPCNSCISEVIKKLIHGYDGPVTDFVIISRGCQLLADGKFSSEIVANAIKEALDVFETVEIDS